MTNLLLYAEARERLVRLCADASRCSSAAEHPLAYPAEWFDREDGQNSEPASSDNWLDELFGGRLAAQLLFALS